MMVSMYFLLFFFTLYTAKIMRKVNQFLIYILMSKNNLLTNNIKQIQNKKE